MELSKIALVVLIALIISYSFYNSVGLRVTDFLYNARETKLRSTLTSVVAGNIGAGTIYGLYSFGASKPILALSIAVSYAIGLAIAGVLSKRIRAACAELTEVSLVGFIARRHGVHENKVWIIWIAIGAVFALQLSVELAAVGDIIGNVFGANNIPSLLISAATVGSYVVVGGYRSTTVTSRLQAPIVVGTIFFVGFGLSTYLTAQSFPPNALHSSHLIEPIGAFFLIAPAVFLSVDNWHRIVTAKSDLVARRGFFLGALVCVVAYTIVVFAGMLNGPGISPTRGLSTFLPTAIAWLIPVVMSVAIFSVMDTTIPPLVAGMPGSDRSLFQARIYTIVLIAIITLLAVFLGNIVQGIVAAFSSLTVFLPATISALFRKTNSPIPVLVGIPISIVASVFMVKIFAEYTLAVSLFVSAFLYIVLDIAARYFCRKL